MKQITHLNTRFFILVLLFLSVSFSSVLASESYYNESYDGKINAVKDIPGKQIQLKLGDSWFELDRTAAVYMCGKQNDEIGVKNLNDFLGYMASITPSNQNISHALYIICE